MDQVPEESPRQVPPNQEHPRLDGAELAWLAAVPAAVLTVAVILIAGVPLGRLLFPVNTLDFWPSALDDVYPESTEKARYLIALGGAVLVPLAIFAGTRRRLGRPPFTRPAVIASQLVFVAVLVCGLLSQKGAAAITGEMRLEFGYFTVPTIAVAVLVGAAFVVGLSWRPAHVRARALLVDQSRPARWGAAAAAALATLIWLLPAIQLDGTVANADPSTYFALFFTFDEGLSVLNGHVPLVDYIAQYGSLWPYLAAIPLHFTNGSLGSFTAFMAAITAVSMLAMFGVLRQVTRSPLGALALFLPFLATSFFILQGNPITRYSFGDYFGVFPLRHAGPYLVGFLIARHLSGGRPRLAIWIFLAAGFTLLNNADFGVPALGASIVAVVAGAPAPRTRRWSLELLFEVLGGLIAAYALVSIATLAQTGEMPQLGLLFKYAQLFALAGYYMLPMPWFGFWVVIYLTFAAALAVAAAMAVRRSEERTLIGMLAWIGIFGLGIGSYYSGRSHPDVLIAMFSTWSFALALLVVAAVRSSAASRWRHLGPAQIALFVGFGLTVCSLAQFPTPWGSLERLRSPASVELFRPRAEAEFVAAHSTPDEPVAFLSRLGQRLSHEAGVDNVTSYTGSISMPTKQQLRETVSRLREAGGSNVVLRESEAWPEMIPALERAGFQLIAREPANGAPPSERLVIFTYRQTMR